MKYSYHCFVVLEGAEKVVGWALSHHLMQNTQVDPDMTLVISLER